MDDIPEEEDMHEDGAVKCDPLVNETEKGESSENVTVYDFVEVLLLENEVYDSVSVYDVVAMEADVNEPETHPHGKCGLEGDMGAVDRIVMDG